MTISTPVGPATQEPTHEQPGQADIDGMSDEESGELLFTRLMETKALFSTQEVLDLEDAFTQGWGFTRRAGLRVLTKPGKELYDKFQEDRDLALAMVVIYDNLSKYGGMLREFADLMENAHSRLMLAYSGRTDADKIFEEGRSIETNQ